MAKPLKSNTLSVAKKLFNRNYLMLWQGQLVSNLGSQVYSIAIVIWLKHTLETSGAVGSWIGSFFMFTALPAVFFSAFGGAVADRFSRKKIIVLSDTLNGTIVLILGLFLMNYQGPEKIAVLAVFAVGMSMSTLGSFFGPAISASIPDLVPEKKLQAANSMSQLSQKSSVFFGQGLGQPLMALLGLPVLVIANGISYLISAFSESFIHIPQIIPERAKGLNEYVGVFKADLKEGLQYIWKKAGLKRLLVASVVLNFLTMPIIILLPFFVEDYLKIHIRWYGFFLAIYGIGALVGFMMAGIFSFRGRRRTRYLIAFMLAEPIGYSFISFIHSPLQAGVLFFLGGLFSGLVMVHIMTILQLTTPSTIRGRVFGTNTMIASSTAPLGMGLGGFLYDVFNHDIALLYTSAGILMIVLILVTALNKDFRSFVAFDEEEVEPIGFTYNVRHLKEEETKKSQKEIYLEYQLQKPRSEI